MSYIGNTPTSQAFAPGTDTFSGTGSQTAFTLSRNVSTVNDILVVVNNVEQQPSHYTVSGTTLTFSPAPSAGTNNIYVRYLSTNLQSIVPQQGSVTPASLSTPNALYWDTSGNVGIGTSSPNTKLDAVNSGTTSTIIQTRNGTTSVYLDANNGYSYLNTYTNHPMLFGTNNAERMRIDTSGNLLVNASSSQPAGASYPGQVSVISAGGSTKTGINIATSSSSASKMIEFQYTGFGVAGVITTTVNSTAYTTSSDYRLKENVQPMVGALQKIAQLKPCSYTWKFDGSASEGFIAHELAEVCPNAVVGVKDEVDKNGKPIYQGIDTSFLVATLTAAIQEQQAMIEELKTKVAALEAR